MAAFLIFKLKRSLSEQKGNSTRLSCEPVFIWQSVFSSSSKLSAIYYYPNAVHKALVNAIVHRDYMIQGSEIHIDMYDDRLEIVPPGGTPDGKRIQDLNIDEISSIRRNPVICDIFSRLKLMERRGSGLQKIIDEYLDNCMPSFRSTEQSFVVTLKT